MERDLPCALRRAVRRHAVGRARGGGASLKGFGSRYLDHSVLDHDLKRRCTPEGVRRIVYASRYPPTLSHEPTTPQLQVAKDLLLTAERLQKTGGLEGSSGELLEAAWGLKNLFWRALGDVLEAH